MVADIVAYAVLASIFVVTGLRMVVEKPTGVSDRSFTWLERFKRRATHRSNSIDS